MMKKVVALLIVAWLFNSSAIAQVKIHAHNDYQKPRPLFDALACQSYSIEADVYLYKEKLVVAHASNERSTRRTLENMYIAPIVELFKKNNGRISADENYSPNLMIDVKQDGAAVLSELTKLIEPLRQYFDRSVNPMAVRIIISGERGDPSTWIRYPSYIFFDGRPTETYNAEAYSKLAQISDNYFNYLIEKNNRADTLKLRAASKAAHEHHLPIRFWGAPDNEETWLLLRNCDVDIINTDKPAACRFFFDSRARQ